MTLSRTKVADGAASIRTARPDDLDKLADVERSAASLFRDAGMAWIADGDTMDRMLLEDCCDRGMLWVAVGSNDDPVGFLCAHELDGMLHVAEVSVARSHQQQGVGAALMTAAIAKGRAAGFRTATLTTYRDLPWNGPFYARLGFSESDPEAMGPGHLGKLAAEAEAGHDLARRCVMSITL